MFHPYSFYLQKHKNAKIKRESALPFFSFPLLLHLVIHTPNVPNRLWNVPFYHLGYPISPFGVSHFTFWGIPFYHLGCPISPFGVYFRHICAQCTARFSVCHLRFRCKIYAFSLSLRKIDLAPFCIFVILHLCVFAFCKCETASVRQLKHVSLRSLTRIFDDVPSSKELTLGLPQINSGILSLNRSFVILCFCIFAFLHFANAKLLPFGN